MSIHSATPIFVLLLLAQSQTTWSHTMRPVYIEPFNNLLDSLASVTCGERIAEIQVKLNTTSVALLDSRVKLSSVEDMLAAKQNAASTLEIELAAKRREVLIIRWTVAALIFAVSECLR